jgi:hypothetical protein
MSLTLLCRIALASICLAVWFMVSVYAGLNAPRSAIPAMGTLLGRPAVAIAASGLLVAVIGTPASGLRVLAHPVLTCLGRISCGLYVYHMASLMLGRHIFRTCDFWADLDCAFHHGVVPLVGGTVSASEGALCHSIGPPGVKFHSNSNDG